MQTCLKWDSLEATGEGVGSGTAPTAMTTDEVVVAWTQAAVLETSDSVESIAVVTAVVAATAGPAQPLHARRELLLCAARAVRPSAVLRPHPPAPHATPPARVARVVALLVRTPLLLMNSPALLLLLLLVVVVVLQALLLKALLESVLLG